MFELKDEIGKPLFETISISLVCGTHCLLLQCCRIQYSPLARSCHADDCMKTEHPEACTHKLSEMPRWLSSKKLEVVKQLLADDPAMLLRESLGVGSDATQRAFSSTDITAFFARAKTSLGGMYSYNRAPPVLVAVDPAGGGASAFAVASCVQLATGGLMVRASPPPTHTHSQTLLATGLRGQLPKGSPGHISMRITHSWTKASGDWHP